MNEENVKRLALVIAANCMKDSVIEACQQQNKVSDNEISAFNQQLSDRLYTFLTYLLTKPADEYTIMMEAMLSHYPDDWPQPMLDQHLIQDKQLLETAVTPSI
ncbi:MAG: hypothetical protein PUP46_07240 [Endozoicomonas sp. (ex Botrylloides leachii)]|nr:hypothetical protein [Endozoicomonas sp. (ex Botrylloides leachii)]